ncbi:hypothetical protein EVAR_68775_1 [Eumeta japonica]|uniref:Uncharacterized protein n=1 Tax=Eumeta variegata TaxID=151549 RepID=A0A4C1TE85_EUMVA|nr:hypothetical protein EVAR_68775_1 [Eumeta japonica]
MYRHCARRAAPTACACAMPSHVAQRVGRRMPYKTTSLQSPLRRNGLFKTPAVAGSGRTFGQRLPTCPSQFLRKVPPHNPDVYFRSECRMRPNEHITYLQHVQHIVDFRGVRSVQRIIQFEPGTARTRRVAHGFAPFGTSGRFVEGPRALVPSGEKAFGDFTRASLGYIASAILPGSQP